MKDKPSAWLWWLVGLALAAGLPYIITDAYTQHLLILCCFNIVLALSLNLLIGFAGQISFAHAAFFGVGAYTSALLATRLGISFWLALPAGGVMSAVLSLLIGLPSLRLRGHYLAIATLGFQEIVVIVISQWVSLTRGPMGITGIPKPRLGRLTISALEHWYLLALALVALTVLFMIRVSRSRLALELLALRENEVAARSMGVNTVKMKLIAFTGSAFVAGLAGGVYASYINSIDPYSFTVWVSAIIILMVYAGGVGSIVGGIVSAVILTLLPEFLRPIAEDQFRMVIFGGVLILIIMFMPEGMAGFFEKIRGRLVPRKFPEV